MREEGYTGLLREKAGIGNVFDCCGKPVAELGLKEYGISPRTPSGYMTSGTQKTLKLWAFSSV